jgi:cell division protein FtsW
MKKGGIDYILLFAILCLIFLGIIILASVSVFISQEKIGNSFYYFFHQIKFGLLPGTALFLFFLLIPLEKIKKIAIFFILAAFFLMLLVFIPKIGVSIGGASRWVNFGFFSIQPSEFLKLFFLIYFSSWLSVKTEKKRLIPFFAIIIFLAILLELQSDLGTLGIILVLALAVYFSSGAPLWHALLLLFFVFLGAGTLVKLAPYRIKRLLVFLNPDQDPMGIGYQIKQALIAVGSGGIFGLGLDMSSQKFGFLPQTMTDSIFAIFAEEAGFAGSLFLIILFLVIFWRMVKIAKSSQDKFCFLFPIGVGVWFCFQAFINIGSMIGIMPLTGIPMPFVSYGGSHLISEMAAIGLVLNISKYRK